MGSGVPSQADKTNATGTNPTNIVLSSILSNVSLFHWLEVYRSQTTTFAYTREVAGADRGRIRQLILIRIWLRR